MNRKNLTFFFLKILVVVIALFLGYADAYAQQGTGNNNYSPVPTPPLILPPSPTVAGIMKFEEVPIDYHTGQPDISIPLFSKKLHKDLSLNLALRYSTTGVQVRERSGWTGTGWSLEAGGVISRTVRDLPDEYRKEFDGKSVGVLHNDDFWNYDNLHDTIKNEFNWNILGTSTNDYDSEVDLYQFSVLGQSGRFVIVKEGGVLVAKLLSLNQHYKIDISYNTQTLIINSFTITDTNGYRYVFNHSQSMTATTTYGYEFSGHPDSRDWNPVQITYNSSWHLSKVFTSNGIQLVTFSYQGESVAYAGPQLFTINDITHLTTGDFSASIQDVQENDYNWTILRPSKQWTKTEYQTGGLHPDKIDFLDGTSISFDLSHSHPEYSLSGNVLERVSLKGRDGLAYKHFDFNYTVGNRLWLSGITEVAGDIEQYYKLDYVYPDQLPTVDTTPDLWGYAPTGKAGLLSSIVYPTGGKKVFDFERHTYSYIGDQFIPDEEIAGNEENVVPVSYAFSWPNGVTFNTSQDGPVLGETTLSFDHDQEGSILVDVNATVVSDHPEEGFSGPDGSTDVIDNTWLHVRNDAGESVMSVKLSRDEILPINLPKGQNWKVTLETIQEGVYTLEGTVVLRYEKLVEVSQIKKYQKGGGYRIKNIQFFDRVSSTNPSRDIHYGYTSASNENESSGAIDGWGSIKNDFKVTTVKHLFEDDKKLQLKFKIFTIEYNVYTESINVPLTKGGYVGYDRVTRREVGNGYTEYIYTNVKTYPNKANTGIFPFFPPRNLDYKRGLLRFSRVYDEDGKILKKTKNDYDFQEIPVAPFRRVVDQELCPWKQFYDAYSQYKRKSPATNLIPLGNTVVVGGPNNGQTVQLPISLAWDKCGDFPPAHIFSAVNDKYDVYSGWPILLSSEETNYYYSQTGSQISKSVTQSFEYNNENHLPSLVTRTWTEKGETRLLQTRTFYPVGSPTVSSQEDKDEMIALNQIDLPLKIEVIRDNEVISTTQNIYEVITSNGGLTPNQVVLRNVKTAQFDNPLENRLNYLRYDEMGNVLEASKPGDQSPTIYLWSYKSTIPIAKIDNATYDQISGVINPSILSQYINQSAVNTDIQTLRGDAAMKDAMIYSYDYSPELWLIGEKDPNGLEARYEYDGMGRLQYIIDHNGHVLSQYEYQYRNQN